MIKKFIICIFLTGFMFQIGAQDVREVDRNIMNHLFNAEWNIADSLIDLQITVNPDHPKYYFMKAPMYFYTRYFSGGAFSNDSLMQLVADYAQKAIDIGEDLEETTELKFYIGSAYGFLSRIHIMRREFWDGYWAARSCRNLLEEVLEEDPNLKDAYLGLAVIEYYPAVALTGFYNTIAWFVGMSGDRDAGLRHFQEVADAGKLFNIEAEFILGLMYRFQENNPERSYQMLSNLQPRFPNNNFINTQHQQAHLAYLIDRNGVAFLEAEFDSLQSRYNINSSFILNGMGYYLLGQNRLDEAEVVFQINIKLYPGVANCYDSMGECYMTRGEDEKALEYYKIAWEKLETDTTITDQFRAILEQGIPARIEELEDRIGG